MEFYLQNLTAKVWEAPSKYKRLVMYVWLEKFQFRLLESEGNQDFT